MSGASAAGACAVAYTWNPTDVAPGQSTLSGVLAGFVFGGIVVVLSVRAASRTEEASRALKLLLCSFFGLTVVAYLLADQAGDHTCLRADSEETLSGGMLGAFAIIMIVALSWLIVAYDLQVHGVLRFLHRLIYFASAFVVLLLCTSSYSYLQHEVPDGAEPESLILFFLIGALSWLIMLPKGSHILASLAAPVARRPRAGNHWPRLIANRFTHITREPVDRCAWTALAYLAVAAITDGVVLALPDSIWNQPPVPAVYLLAWAALLFPLFVLVLAIRALAPEGGRGANEETPAQPRPTR